MSTVFERVRAAAAAVAAQADHVHISPKALRGLARRLDLDVSDDDPGHAPLDDPESTAAFVLALDAVNFGSGYFPHLRKRRGMSGYRTVAACLRRYATAHGPITARWLRRVSAADAAELLEQAPRGVDASVDELMGLYARSWNDLGDFIERAGGTVLGAVAQAGGSAEHMIASLTEMPLYRDVHAYRGMEAPFYKRAQITVFDLAAALSHSPPAEFADLDELTMFADNLVPHVLRIEGALSFSNDLLARVEAGYDIASGSEPEIEIRACGLHAVELLTKLLRRQGRRCTPAQVDGVLWRMGGRRVYKAEPRHRTRCAFY